MGTTSSRESTPTIGEVTNNLKLVQDYINDHKSEINTSDKKKIEEFLLTFNKQLKRIAKNTNGSKNRNVYEASKLIVSIREQLKEIQNAPSPGYTLPKVDELINLFENNNNNNSFRKNSLKLEKNRSSLNRKLKPKESYEILRKLSLIEVDIKTKNFTSKEIDELQKELIGYAQLLPQKNRTSEIERIFKTISILQSQLINLKPVDRRSSPNDEDLDGGTVETNSFTHYPNSIKQIMERIKSDLGLLQNFLNSSSTFGSIDFGKTTREIEEIERDIKRIKKRIYEENFKWTKSKSKQNLQILQEIEEEINKYDFLQLVKQKGKEETSLVLNNFKARIVSIESLDIEITAKKTELLDLIQGISKFINDSVVETALAKLEIDHNKFKQQIINFSDSEQSADYKNFMGYLLQLKKYTNKLQSEDEAILEKKNKIIEEINRSMKILKHKAQKFDLAKTGKGTTEKQQNILMQLLRSYAMQLDDIERSIKNGTREGLEEKLEAIRNSLLNLNITKDNPNFAKKRNNYLEQIDGLLSLLKEETPEVVVMRKSVQNEDTSKKLNSLKKKVHRFTGSYQNVLYKTIEKDFRKILAELDNNDEQTRLEILKHLKILEEKSTKNTDFKILEPPNDIDTSRKTLTLVRKELDSIKMSEEPSKAELSRVKSQMDFCYDKLDSLVSKDPNIQQEKIVLYKEIKEVSNTLSDRIQKKAEEINNTSKKQPNEEHLRELDKIRDMLNQIKMQISKFEGKDDSSIKDGLDACYTMLSSVKEPSLIEERSALYKDIGYWSETYNKKCLQNNQPIEKQPISILQEVENEIYRVKPQIEAFSNGENSQEYVVLDEVLIEMTLKLDKCKFDRGSEEFQQRRKLLRMIQELSDLLEDRLQEVEDVGEIDKDVNVLMMRLDGLSNNLGQENVDSLNKEWQRLFERVNGLKSEQPQRGKLLENLNSCKEKLDQL